MAADRNQLGYFFFFFPTYGLYSNRLRKKGISVHIYLVWIFDAAHKITAVFAARPIQDGNRQKIIKFTNCSKQRSPQCGYARTQ